MQPQLVQSHRLLFGLLSQDFAKPTSQHLDMTKCHKQLNTYACNNMTMYQFNRNRNMLESWDWEITIMSIVNCTKVTKLNHNSQLHRQPDVMHCITPTMLYILGQKLTYPNGPRCHQARPANISLLTQWHHHVMFSVCGLEKNNYVIVLGIWGRGKLWVRECILPMGSHPGRGYATNYNGLNPQKSHRTNVSFDRARKYWPVW